jgi:hypothetical protein
MTIQDNFYTPDKPCHINILKVVLNSLITVILIYVLAVNNCNGLTAKL